MADPVAPEGWRSKQFKMASACHRVVAIAGLLLALSGCAGTVIVDYEIQAQVSGRDASGREWVARPEDIVTIPRPPGITTPFSAQAYRGPDFEWTFGTGTLGFGGDMMNRSSGRLCMRFDEATMSSNVHPAPLKLRVSHLVHTVDGAVTRVGSTDPKKLTYYDPPPLCFAPGKRGHISMAPDLTMIFPQRTMFNVRWPQGVPELSDKGVGNFFELDLPVELDGKAQRLRVRLTAQDSKARISNY